MSIKKKRAPGGGRSRKINAAGVADILASKEKVAYLAHIYKVHHDTIYRLFRERRKKNMHIDIELQPDDIPENEMEHCIFCDEKTAYWHVLTNRPVCTLCSVVNSPADISRAPYNY